MTSTIEGGCNLCIEPSTAFSLSILSTEELFWTQVLITNRSQQKAADLAMALGDSATAVDLQDVSKGSFHSFYACLYALHTGSGACFDPLSRSRYLQPLLRFCIAGPVLVAPYESILTYQCYLHALIPEYALRLAPETQV